jgi:predicted flap endonuclease-1-like 5' DNA nuclease
MGNPYQALQRKEDYKVAKLTEIEGVGAVYAQQLREAGIETTRGLLKNGASPGGRKEIAEQTGISPKLILEWVNHVDLFRIRGVAEEYADLLEEAGVDTVPELAQRNAENLYQKMVAVNLEKKLVRRLPALTQVSDWIQQAKQLPRVINY